MSDALLDALQVLPDGNAAVLSSLLEKVIDEVTHPVALYNRNGAIVAANQPFRAMHGFSAAEPLPESNVAAGLFEVTTLEGRQLSAEEWPLMRALAGEVVRDAELRVRRTDCEATWVARYSIRPICDARGETLLIVASAENIGTQKRMEEALRKSEIRTRSLVEANIIGVVSADIYGQVREANDEFLRITGFTHHDLTGGLVRWDKITPPEHLLKDEHAIAEAQLHGSCRPYRKEYIHRDGHRVPVLIGFALIGEEREEAVAFILDLTAQKGVEDALRRSEERYRSLIAATTSIVWTAGPSGEFVEPQEAWDAYTGQSWEEHRGFGWFAMVHEEDRERMQTQWQQAIATSTRWLGNGRVWHQESREHRHFEVRAVPIFDTFGKVREWVGTAVDMHEHRLAQEAEHRARREAEAANRAKDEFLAVLSHELRTPLTPAFLSIDELMENPQLPEAVRAELTVVRRNLGHETKLIDDLLDMTRIQSGKLELRLEVLDLHDVLRDTARDCLGDCRRKNLELHVDLRAKESHVRGDAVRLRQVFWNLLRNSVKFTPAGGSIELRTQTSENGQLSVQVRDSGIGIPPERLPRLFDRFEQGGAEVTRRFGGLGLGLAITKSLLDLHKATIHAESSGPGEGASFYVQLPTVAAVPRMEQSGLTAFNPAPQGVKILLVEDHDDTRITLARLLKRQGHDVLSAGSCGSALIVARAREFDILISDIGLPDGSGLDLLGQLPEGTRAISLSGFGMEKDVAASKAAGYVAHLTKPVDFEQLNAIIRDTVRAGRAAS